jgi:hypothetical protein
LTPLKITLDLAYGDMGSSPSSQYNNDMISKLLCGGDVGTYKINLIFGDRKSRIEQLALFRE